LGNQYLANCNLANNSTGLAIRCNHPVHEALAPLVPFIVPGLPKWPAFTAKDGALMVFDNKCEVRMNPDGEARRVVFGA
jgi:carboxylesterase type B